MIICLNCDREIKEDEEAISRQGRFECDWFHKECAEYEPIVYRFGVLDEEY